MTAAEIIAELDDAGFDDKDTSIKLSALNQVYWEVCGLEPWPFLERTVTLTFDGSSGVPVNLSAMVPTLTDLHAVTSIRNNQITAPLDYIDFDEFQESRPTTLITGTPRYFYFEQGVLTVYPIPAATATLKLAYISTPDALDAASTEADILLPKQYHRGVLVNGTIAELYAREEDTDITASFLQYKDVAVAKMREFMWRRQYQRQMVVVPVDVDEIDDP